MKKKINIVKSFDGTVEQIRQRIKTGLTKRLQNLTSLKFTDAPTCIKVEVKGFDAVVELTQKGESVLAECTISLGFLLRPFAAKIEKEINQL